MVTAGRDGATRFGCGACAVNMHFLVARPQSNGALLITEFDGTLAALQLMHRASARCPRMCVLRFGSSTAREFFGDMVLTSMYRRTRAKERNRASIIANWDYSFRKQRLLHRVARLADFSHLPTAPRGLFGAARARHLLASTLALVSVLAPASCRPLERVELTRAAQAPVAGPPGVGGAPHPAAVAQGGVPPAHFGGDYALFPDFDTEEEEE